MRSSNPSYCLDSASVLNPAGFVASFRHSCERLAEQATFVNVCRRVHCNRWLAITVSELVIFMLFQTPPDLDGRVHPASADKARAVSNCSVLSSSGEHAPSADYCDGSASSSQISS